MDYGVGFRTAVVLVGPMIVMAPAVVTAVVLDGLQQVRGASVMQEK
jgi:5,10-methenyltetrahydromethanopterin hydrogenase